MLCVYLRACVCVCVSPAMSAHTTADSGARRSCRPGGHEVREGGKGKKW